MALNTDLISRKVEANRDTLLGFGVKKLGLFGSYSRNQQKKTSDIDILVEFGRGKKNADNFLVLAIYLESILKKKVDLLTSESLTPTMKRRVLSEVKYFQL